MGECQSKSAEAKQEEKCSEERRREARRRECTGVCVCVRERERVCARVCREKSQA